MTTQHTPTPSALAQDVASLCMELRLQKIEPEDSALRNRAADMLRFLHDRLEALATASAEMRATFTPEQSHFAYKQDATRRNQAIVIDHLSDALTLIAEGNEQPGHCNAITKARMAEIASAALKGAKS